MEYTVNVLAKLAGVSPRTLRYYDEIGLLAPQYINSSGYRIYGQKELDLLQQILFYRELEIRLEEIASILYAPSFDRMAALREHLAQLSNKRLRLDRLIHTVEQTIQMEKGEIEMNNEEKFQGFKEQMVQENEEKYGEEIRQKYGEEAVNTSNAKMMGMTQEDYLAMQEISKDLAEGLKHAVRDGVDPLGEEGRRLAALHKSWLGYTWTQYSIEAHRGLAQMYLEDERFTMYYDSEVPGCAQFLRDAIYGFTDL